MFQVKFLLHAWHSLGTDLFFWKHFDFLVLGDYFSKFLIVRKADNPLPKHDNEENLANEFADYFIGKIEKIRQELNVNSKYTHSNDSTPILAEFTEMTQDEVQKIIMNLATKNCELDPFPTSILKEVLPALLPSITTMMIYIFKTGCLCTEMENSSDTSTLKESWPRINSK